MTTAPIPIPGAVSDDFLFEDSDGWNSADGGGAVQTEISSLQFAAGGGEESPNEGLEHTETKYTCAVPHKCVIRCRPDSSADVIEIREGATEIIVRQVWGGWLCLLSGDEEGWTVSNSWHPSTHSHHHCEVPQAESTHDIPTRQFLSSSAPPCGSVFLETDIKADLTTTLNGLDLSRGDEPTLRASIPVQRNLAYNNRRKYGRDDACSDDCMWLLSEPKTEERRERESRRGHLPSSQPRLSYGSGWERFASIYSQQQTLTVPSLLFKWLCALVGILSYTLCLSKIHNISTNKKYDETLIASWASEIAALIYASLFLLGLVHSKLKGNFDFGYDYSSLFVKRGVLLLVVSSVTSAVAGTMWFLSLRWLPRDISLLGWSFHPLCVLCLAYFLGVKSKIGEKVGVATILLGAACSGISDLVGPDRTTTSTLDAVTGGGLSFGGGMLFALFLILSTPLRKKLPSLHAPSGWSIPLSLYMFMITVVSCLTLYSSSVIFFTDSSGMQKPTFFGWKHLAKDAIAAGVLLAVGNAGLIGALGSLPPVVISAVFALQPVLTFLYDLAMQNSDKGVPLPTRTVGALCSLAGTICVCRSAVALIAVVNEPTNSTGSGSRHHSGCSGCMSRGPQSCPVHGIDTLDALPTSSRRPRRSSPRLPRVRGAQDFQIPTNRVLQVQAAPEEEPTPRRHTSK